METGKCAKNCRLPHSSHVPLIFIILSMEIEAEKQKNLFLQVYRSSTCSLKRWSLVLDVILDVMPDNTLPCLPEQPVPRAFPVDLSSPSVSLASVLRVHSKTQYSLQSLAPELN